MGETLAAGPDPVAAASSPAMEDRTVGSGSDTTLFFGGLEGATGDYCLAPLAARELADWMQRSRRPRLLRAGLDETCQAEAGWGVVWCEGVSADMREAMKPLLEHRRERAGDRFRELYFFRGQTTLDFLEYYSVGPDTVDPSKVPYYLLIVGSPEQCPFEVQAELSVARAVGRLDFPSAESCELHVQRLVAHELRLESGSKEAVDHVPDRRPRLSFFGVENPDDPASRLAVEHFVEPLARRVAERNGDFDIERCTRSAATKGRLREILADPPAVLLTAGHGVRYRPHSPRQPSHQGALVCADWPGPERWKDRAMLDEHLFTAADLGSETDLSGLLAFLFACYSVGTPHLDAYVRDKPVVRAPEPFVSPLPRALMRQGALAVIGHVDMAYEQSFYWYRAGPQLEVFDSFIHEVVRSKPVGLALRHLAHRHAQLAAHLAGAMDRASQDRTPIDIRDLHLWAAYVDARNYILLGDPAARLGPGSKNIEGRPG